MFKVIAFANTLAIIDLILHPLFHLWISNSSPIRKSEAQLKSTNGKVDEVLNL